MAILLWDDEGQPPNLPPSLRQGKHPGGVQAALRRTGEPNDPLLRRVLPKDLGQAAQILAVLLQ